MGCYDDYGTTGYGTAATKTIWVRWATDSTSSSTSDTWSNWCEAYEKTSSTSSATTWVRWNDAADKYQKMQRKVVTAKPVELTEEQKAEREAKRLAEVERQLREAEAAKVALEKSIALLKSLLTDEQLETYEKDQKFFVIGSDGQRYEVDCRDRHRNVFAVDESGKRTKGYCAYQTGNLPIGDNHVAQKLALEADADAFKRVANAFSVAM